MSAFQRILFKWKRKKSNFPLIQGRTAWLNINPDSVAEGNQLLERHHFYMNKKKGKRNSYRQEIIKCLKESVKISEKKKQNLQMTAKDNDNVKAFSY